MLSCGAIRKRLEFAKQFMGFDFSKVIFSDEKIWRIRPCSKNRVKVWRRRGDRYDAKYVAPTSSRSVGVMVWCAINGDGDMVWARCKDKVKAEDYQDVLKKHIKFIRPSRCAYPNVLGYN